MQCVAPLDLQQFLWMGSAFGQELTGVDAGPVVEAFAQTCGGGDDGVDFLVVAVYHGDDAPRNHDHAVLAGADGLTTQVSAVATGDDLVLGHALAVFDHCDVVLGHNLFVIDAAVVDDMQGMAALFFVFVEQTILFGEDGAGFGLHTGLENFDDTGQPLGDVVGRCHTASVEGTQGQLSARFTDGLGGDNTDSFTEFDQLARR